MGRLVTHRQRSTKSLLKVIRDPHVRNLATGERLSLEEYLLMAGRNPEEVRATMSALRDAQVRDRQQIEPV